MPKPRPGKKSITVTIDDGVYEEIRQWSLDREWSIAKGAARLIEIALSIQSGMEPEIPKPTLLPQKSKK